MSDAEATDSQRPLQELQSLLRKFAADRDWEQFHTPKNLATALTVEAAELLEHFQWLTAEQSASLSESQREEVRMELADIFLYLLRLADKLHIDLVAAGRDKIAINAQKYPAEKARGSHKKYTEL